MPRNASPQSLTLRTYNVGFGDCFLLSFHYAAGDRHVLIDFGSTGTKRASPDKLMMDIAKDIAKVCGGKLHAVVATHRHKDHISGFTTKKGGKGTGDLIASLKPDVVIQPWTEDPKAKSDARKPTSVQQGLRFGATQFLATLDVMHSVSASSLEEVIARPERFGTKTASELRFLAADNLGEEDLANRSAIENLEAMSKKHFYVHFGSKSGFEDVLPGVNTRVLGPPTLEQSDTILNQRSSDKDEFWQLAAFWATELRAHTFRAGKGQLFPNARRYRAGSEPPYTRWLLGRIRDIRASQMLGIVRALDQAMNNTSVILLFEVNGTRLLFPGDAQIENWAYALSKKECRELLKDVELYKVGHHGSRNATPRSLWNLFEHKHEEPAKDRLRTVMSTMPGKHGNAASHTEVPRATLVKELKKFSDYFSTHEMRVAQGLCGIEEIPFK